MKARRVKRLDPRDPLIENAARIVRVRMDEVRSLGPPALEIENEVEQHDLRIACKRLRYVLESTGFCFGKPADAARRAAKDLQGILGDLHDCDVMAPRVEGHVARLRAEDATALRERAGDVEGLRPALVADAPNRTAYRGLSLLMVDVAARRALLFDLFRESWGEIEQAGTWSGLELEIDRRVKAGRERRQALRRAAEAAYGAADGPS